MSKPLLVDGQVLRARALQLALDMSEAASRASLSDVLGAIEENAFAVEDIAARLAARVAAPMWRLRRRRGETTTMAARRDEFEL